MLTLNEIFDLAINYKIYNIDNQFISKIISQAKSNIEEVIKPSREYPPFLYYIVLSYLDGKNCYIKFSDLLENDKRRYINETINEIERIGNLDTTDKMFSFLNEMRKVSLPYRNRYFNKNTIVYTFNTDSHLSNVEALCDLMNLECQTEIASNYHEHKLTIYF